MGLRAGSAKAMEVQNCTVVGGSDRMLRVGSCTGITRLLLRRDLQLVTGPYGRYYPTTILWLVEAKAKNSC